MIHIHWFAMRLLGLRCINATKLSVDEASEKASNSCLGKYLLEEIKKYDTKSSQSIPMYMKEFDEEDAQKELEDILSQVSNYGNGYFVSDDEGLVYIVCGILNYLENQIETLQQEK